MLAAGLTVLLILSTAPAVIGFGVIMRNNDRYEREWCSTCWVRRGTLVVDRTTLRSHFGPCERCAAQPVAAGR